MTWVQVHHEPITRSMTSCSRLDQTSTRRVEISKKRKIKAARCSLPHFTKLTVAFLHIFAHVFRAASVSVHILEFQHIPCMTTWTKIHLFRDSSPRCIAKEICYKSTLESIVKAFSMIYDIQSADEISST